MTKRTRKIIIISAAIVLAVAVIIAVLIVLEREKPVDDSATTTSSESVNWENLSYAEFLELSLEQQTAFKDSFADKNEYLQWYWAAYDAWKAEQNPEDDSDDKIVVDDKDTVIDADDLVGDDA